MDDNAWKRGLQRIAPGVYADRSGSLHIDEEELLAAHGYVVDKQNSEMLREVAVQIIKEHGLIPEFRIDYSCQNCGAIVSDPAKHSCITDTPGKSRAPSR
jgi:hypothetical protein